jgi:hypothetical protein
VEYERSQTVREKNVVMSPVGLGTKNHCAGEGQQQFSSQSVRVVAELSSELVELESPEERLSWSWDSVVRDSCGCKRINCELLGCQLYRVQRDSVVIGCKCTINPITNPNPVYSHLTRDNMFYSISHNIVSYIIRTVYPLLLLVSRNLFGLNYL